MRLSVRLKLFLMYCFFLVLASSSFLFLPFSRALFAASLKESCSRSCGVLILFSILKTGRISSFDIEFTFSMSNITDSAALARSTPVKIPLSVTAAILPTGGFRSYHLSSTSTSSIFSSISWAIYTMQSIGLSLIHLSTFVKHDSGDLVSNTRILLCTFSSSFPKYGTSLVVI